MKNSNSYQVKKQDRKFNNQVNHLQSFIGMPMWNGRSPSLSEIREYDRRLLEKQALGFEPKRKSLLSRLISGATSLTSSANGQISKVGEKTKDLRNEITKPAETGSECCG